MYLIRYSFRHTSQSNLYIPGLVAVGSWSTKLTKRAAFSAPLSTLHSLQSTSTQSNHRPFTSVAPHLSSTSTRLFPVIPRIPRQHVVTAPTSRCFSSASPPSAVPETTVDPERALLESNHQSVREAFFQLPTEPLGFLQASPVPLLQALRARPLALHVIHHHVLKALHTYATNVRTYKQKSKEGNGPVLSHKLKSQLSDSYALYRDFWKEVARNPIIPTKAREEMDRAVREHQLLFLMEMENWQEIYLLVQQLQIEAKEERKTQPEGKVKDEGKQVNMAVDIAYEGLVRKICSHCRIPENFQG